MQRTVLQAWMSLSHDPVGRHSLDRPIAWEQKKRNAIKVKHSFTHAALMPGQSFQHEWRRWLASSMQRRGLVRSSGHRPSDLAVSSPHYAASRKAIAHPMLGVLFLGRIIDADARVSWLQIMGACQGGTGLTWPGPLQSIVLGLVEGLSLPFSR